MRRIALVAAAVSACALPAAAGAVTFGSANLAGHTSNSTVTCGQFNVFQYAGRVGCSVYTTGNASNPWDTSATHVIPFPDPRPNGDQHGTITEVTFKPAPGAPAGPARLSVVEYIRDANSTGDPGLAQDVAETANFTMAPGADGLVHVATDLPARSLYNADDNSYRYDVLVLSMLDNTTPIPADLGSQFLSAWISPYVDIPSTQGDLTVPLPVDRQGTGWGGVPPSPFYALGAWYTLGEVLMQAELTIDEPAAVQGPGATTTVPPLDTTPEDAVTPPVQPANPVTIKRGRFARSTATVPVTCVLDAACAGVLQLLSPARAAAAARKPAVYGRATFTIPAHGTTRVKVKLTKAGRKLIKRRKSVRMLVRATIGTRVTATTVTLTRK